MSKATCSSFCVVEYVNLLNISVFVLCDDHLADTFSRFDGLRLVAEVDEYDAYLSAVVSVDGAWGVEDCQSAFEGQSASWSNLRFISDGQFEEKSRGEESPFEGLERDRFGDIAADIHTCRLLALVAG